MKHRFFLLTPLLFFSAASAQVTWVAYQVDQLSGPGFNEPAQNPAGPPLYPTDEGNSQPKVAYAHGAWYFVDGNYFAPKIFNSAANTFIDSLEFTHFFSSPPPGPEFVRALAAGDDFLCAISNKDLAGTIENWESGGTWPIISGTVPGVGTNTRDLAYSPWLDQWIACSASGHIAVRDSGTWTSTSVSSSGGWNAVTAGPPGIVAVSAGGKYGFSTDGSSWSNGTIDSSIDFQDVHYADGLYIAVGDGRIYSSTDGTSWAQRRDDPGSGLVSVTHGNKTWVAIQGNGTRIHYSADGGITWADDITIPSAVSLSEITFGQGIFVAVGPNGNIRWSPADLTVLEPANVFSAAGGTTTINVSTLSSSIRWCASSAHDWINLGHPNNPSGSGTGSFSLALEPNPGPARSGCIEVNGNIITIRQAGTFDPNSEDRPKPRVFPLEEGVFVLWEEFTNATGYVLERLGLFAATWTHVATLPAGTHYHVELDGGWDALAGSTFQYRVSVQVGGGTGNPITSDPTLFPFEIDSVDAVAVQIAPSKVIIARNDEFGDSVDFFRENTKLNPTPSTSFTRIDNALPPHIPGDPPILYTVVGENGYSVPIQVGAVPTWQFNGPDFGVAEPIGNGLMKLSWDPPTANQFGLGANSSKPERYFYKIHQASSPTGPFGQVVTVDSCEHVLAGSPDLFYRIEPVAARTAESLRTADLCTRKPARPTSFTITSATATSIGLSWTFSDYNADEWIIERLVNGGAAWHTPVTITPSGVFGSGSITGLTPGDEHEFRIRSVWRGTSCLPQAAQAGPQKTDLAAPSLTVVRADGPNAIFINWPDLHGAETYEVRRSPNGSTPFASS